MVQNESSIPEYVEYARTAVARDPLAVFMGIELEAIDEAYARLSLTIQPQHLNALDRVHGAVISTMADQAVAVASNATPYDSLVVELKVNFLGAAGLGDTITAEALPLDLKRKLSLWQVEVLDGRGSRVALAQALAYHRPRAAGNAKA